ncbi:MAG TPA: hypothetical protein VKP30_14080, partial [Polyangiaceae bacterium]|nr:hypothetical protein [Polyangiaceae bacterium]
PRNSCVISSLETEGISQLPTIFFALLTDTCSLLERGSGGFTFTYKPSPSPTSHRRFGRRLSRALGKVTDA